jgi:hypothetical protein
MIRPAPMLTVTDTEAEEAAMNIRRRALGMRSNGATRRALARAMARAPTESSRHELQALSGRDQRPPLPGAHAAH